MVFSIFNRKASGYQKNALPKSCADQSPEEVSADIIRIENISKVFQGNTIVRAVDDISFIVKRGEIFGLLGPNGAGKSTLIRILTTLLKPSSGRAYLNNFELSCNPEDIRRIIGVCPQNSTLDIELTAYENLEFYGRLTDVDEQLLPERIHTLLHMAGLSDRAHTRVSTFSGGMKRKLEIVRAFIHEPLILFLDEPTIGLDPESRHEVWWQISRLNTEDTTIILTTHYMDEAEKLCNRIAFVDHGRLITLDTPENLKRSLSLGDLVEIEYDTLHDEILPGIRSIPHIDSVENLSHKILISAKNGSQVLPAIVGIFEKYGDPMIAISIHSPSLEDVFISLTGRKFDDGQEDPVHNLRRRF